MKRVRHTSKKNPAFNRKHPRNAAGQFKRKPKTARSKRKK